MSQAPVAYQAVTEMYIKVLLLLLIINSVVSIDPLVLTKNGLVRGKVAEDGDYSMFLGIPYAKIDPENPFGHTIEVAPFKEPFNATDDSAACPQREDITFNIIGTLDCLNVNVYVPDKADTKNQLPVMVWIHGGGFRRWTSSRESYGPKFLVQRDIILVTFNYRLGVYGFMALNTSEIPGNAGLRDQLAALKWVKENIEAFGGNKEDITLFGQSAGAASVEFHTLSGHSEGLFHKAILQSGTALCDWVMVEPNLNSPIDLANFMNFETNNIEEALKFLANSHPHDVISATLGIGYWELFKPVVEYPFQDTVIMIKDKPSNLLKDGSYYAVPMIFGFTNVERLEDIYHYRQSLETITGYLEESRKTVNAKIQFYFDLVPNKFIKATDLVRQFYFGSDVINEENLYDIVQFDSDFAFVHPIWRSMNYHLNKNNNNIYNYMFAYEGERNYMKYRFNLTEERGASHADEIGYLFEQTYITQPINEQDQLVIDRITTLWTNFAKHGAPTTEVDELVTTSWEPYQENKNFLIINTELTKESLPKRRQIAFLDTLFELYVDNIKW